MGCGNEVLARLALVQAGEGSDGLVLVAGVAARGCQRIGREGHEAVQREAAGDVLNVRVQAAVFVNDQHGGQLVRARAGKAGQVAFDAAGAGGRRVAEPFDFEPWVVLGHLLAGCEVGAQRGQQAGRRHARLGELFRLRKKSAPVQVAVDISVEEDQYFLVKVLGGQACWHGMLPCKSAAYAAGKNCVKPTLTAGARSQVHAWQVVLSGEPRPQLARRGHGQVIHLRMLQRTTSTGIGDSATTLAATLPSMSRAMPLRPCEPTTIRSAPSSLAV